MIAEYRVIYDAIDQGIPWFYFLVPIFAGTIFVFAIRDLKQSIRKRPVPAFRISLLIIWLLGFSLLGPISIIDIFVEQITCINWLKTGHYDVTEGQVKNYYTGPKFDSFDLSTYHFQYYDADLSGCFHDSHEFGGPNLGGRPVRITHNQGVILRIEVRDE